MEFQGTEDVRLDPQLNKEVWKQGIKGVPYRLRVRISRKRNDEEGAKERLFSYVQAVNVSNPKGLLTTVVSCYTESRTLRLRYANESVQVEDQ